MVDRALIPQQTFEFLKTNTQNDFNLQASNMPNFISKNVKFSWHPGILFLHPVLNASAFSSVSLC